MSKKTQLPARATQIAAATRAALLTQGPQAVHTFQAARNPQSTPVPQTPTTTVAPATPTAASEQPSPAAAGGPPPIVQAPAADDGSSSVTRLLVRYLTANRGNSRFMLAVPSAITAAPYIIATGQLIVAFGGITGREQILPDSGLAAYVASGDLRFVLIGPTGSAGSGTSGARWVTANCAVVPVTQWLDCPGSSTAVPTLFDCASRR